LLSHPYRIVPYFLKKSIMKKIAILLLTLFLGTGAVLFCQRNQPPADTAQMAEAAVEAASSAQSSCQSPIEIYENPERLPLRNFVLEEMGDLRGTTVLDIGAGPGFFAFETAKTAGKVIATELDPLFLEYMNKKKAELGIRNFEVRKADEHQSEFEGIRADYALMVYVFHYLEDPKMFLSRLTAALKPGGKVFIANAQLSPVIIKDYLSRVGFREIGEATFMHEMGSCGPQEVQLISATLPWAEQGAGLDWKGEKPYLGRE
jgi:SAM-dependent methyltransferase